MNACRPGLSPDVLDHWRRAIGVDHSLGSNPSRQIRFRGADALNGHIAFLQIEPEDPEGFELHMSRRQLYRHFAQAGESLADMIARRRLEEVCDLLVEQPGMGLEEVAHAVGFSSVSTMRNRFRAEYGMAPTEYRSGPLASSPGTTWQRAADSGEPAASLNP